MGRRFSHGVFRGFNEIGMSKYQNSTDLQVKIYHLRYGVGLLPLIDYISDGLAQFLSHDNRVGHLADQAETLT